jgi:hypothetical protein
VNDWDRKHVIYDPATGGFSMDNWDRKHFFIRYPNDGDSWIRAFYDAFAQIAKERPCRETETRFHMLLTQRRVSLEAWLRWVQANADQIPWCQEVMTTAVTMKLLPPP